jgi:glycosyltransferase involved in cell wall biosynthesis
LRDDAGRDALAHAGRARAEGFTWERCAARTRAVYRSVV